ncbi:hypothetical protein Vafri_938 [Volvox africanus]|nr:hypothetical protein Vafri_938 [Volvox africanus]
MPELPEIEAAKRLLGRGCVGKRIEKAVVANDDKVFEGASPDDIRQALEGRRVIAAHRKGKYLWLELDNREGPWPLLHFGMTGGIVVQKMAVTKYKRIHLESDPEEWPPRFTKLELDLEGGAKLAFVDARRFARVKLLLDPPSQEPLSKLGFDVLDELPPVEQFAAAVRKRVARAPGLKIKALLLDQEFCSGIGNWVGDEVGPCILGLYFPFLFLFIEPA